MTGKVIWFSNAKGYGFVSDSETGKEYFTHYSVIQGKEHYKSLAQGAPVSFDIEQGRNGTQACNVVVLK